ncbi:MAG TPA: hypothetical protein VG223_12055 [Solirubrobacteraceae bacterium]|nr:hypothetical protein [Solirubrobacteraceae bacterium]
MAQIIVTADQVTDQGEGAVMFRERVNLSDFESRHFARQLLERLGWAVQDAHELEHESVGERERVERLDEREPVGTPS